MSQYLLKRNSSSTFNSIQIGHFTLSLARAMLVVVGYYMSITYILVRKKKRKVNRNNKRVENKRMKK